MESFWKKSDLARLAIVAFILAVVIGDRWGYGAAVAIRTISFFASLALFWLAKRWLTDPTVRYSLGGLVVAVFIFGLAFLALIAAVVP